MTKNTMMPIAVTPQQAADITGLSRKVISAALDTGCINYIRVGREGGKRIMLVSDLHDFLEQCAALGLRIDDDPVNMTEVKKTIVYNNQTKSPGLKPKA